ncbi:hypothetical protein GIB67_038628 [Kingdonia uniflora]|uniref:E3 ubiquitin ligase UBR4 C-terminal domain-containing protein n=1 Tax=Kingdonia uniflora TaxID=39325 RepID=A0A7J7NPL7_9MAGN|nr:hypothetical protein GIB67_038628 [Kingdonia uniflora]
METRASSSVAKSNLSAFGLEFQTVKILALLMVLVPASLYAGEIVAEYFELLFKMEDSEDARLFLTARGCLSTLCRLITQEVSNVESQERSLRIGISQGFILHSLIELLNKFLEVPNIRSRFMRDDLLFEVFEVLIVIRGLVLLKTKLISDCNRNLKDLLESLFLESSENKRQFIRAYISGLQIPGEKKGACILEFIGLRERTPEVLASSEDVEEGGLACMVCKGGYSLKPNDLLGIYSYSKRVNFGVGTSDSSRGECAYTTVSHFNIIHFHCHQEAKRADTALKSPKQEWDGATLRNNETRCICLFSLRGPSVSITQYVRYMDQYWDGLNALGHTDGIDLQLLTYDIVLECYINDIFDVDVDVDLDITRLLH